MENIKRIMTKAELDEIFKNRNFNDTEDARRSSATSNKCRRDKAKVLEILDFKGNKLPINKGYAAYDYTFKYEVGKMVSVDNFNEDR